MALDSVATTSYVSARNHAAITHTLTRTGEQGGAGEPSVGDGVTDLEMADKLAWLLKHAIPIYHTLTRDTISGVIKELRARG
jgi:hypothetical protein